MAHGRRGWPLAVLLPVWYWPLVASQDGPSHLYNAAVLNESLVGHGPSTAVYQVAWRPVPNWAGSLVLMALLKVVPLWLVPRLMLSLTAVTPLLVILWLRRQAAGTGGVLWGGVHWGGVLWAVALAGCLATGRAWVMGFQKFFAGRGGRNGSARPV